MANNKKVDIVNGSPEKNHVDQTKWGRHDFRGLTIHCLPHHLIFILSSGRPTLVWHKSDKVEGKVKVCDRVICVFCHLNLLSRIESIQHFYFSLSMSTSNNQNTRVLQRNICSPFPTMTEVNHNLNNQHMLQCDVAVVPRCSLRPTWTRNSLFGYQDEYFG